MKVFLSVMLLLCFSGLTFAADGKVIFVKGSLTINNKVLKIGDLVNEGDVLVAKDKSFGVIKLESGSTIKLNANSSLKISKVRVKKSKSILKLLKGTVFLKYNKKKKNGLILQAKSATMGVRGTEFFAGFNEKDIWMCVNEGIVSVKSKEDQKPVLVKQGEGVLIEKGTTTTSPKSYPWTKKLNWNMNPQKGELESKVEIDSVYTDPLDVDYD